MTDRLTAQEEYLGDGLYASFDGYQVWLRAPREQEDHVVALEPPVLESFERYVAKVRAMLAERARDESGER